MRVEQTLMTRNYVCACLHLYTLKNDLKNVSVNIQKCEPEKNQNGIQRKPATKFVVGFFGTVSYRSILVDDTGRMTHADLKRIPSATYHLVNQHSELGRSTIL